MERKYLIGWLEEAKIINSPAADRFRGKNKDNQNCQKFTGDLRTFWLAPTHYLTLINFHLRLIIKDKLNTQ